jgi:hypothetical protein
MSDELSHVPATRRAEALELSTRLLEDIEFARLSGIDVARRALRLARLLDEETAIRWLTYEVVGYPKPLDDTAVDAAQLSGRQADPAEDDSPRWWTDSLTEMETLADSAIAEIEGLSGSATSSGEMALLVQRDKLQVIAGLRTTAVAKRGTRDRVVGAIHMYVSQRHDQLRFGASVERAFEVLRSEVDSRIAAMVPNAVGMLAAAFENAASANPEHWANAASTCRRLLKEAADALRPAGEPVTLESGTVVNAGPGHYVNRLTLWIDEQKTSDTFAGMVKADLEYLGRRLDAVDHAGQKGAHATGVERRDASRFIVGTYLVLGDVLRLHPTD